MTNTLSFLVKSINAYTPEKLIYKGNKSAKKLRKFYKDFYFLI